LEELSKHAWPIEAHAIVQSLTQIHLAILHAELDSLAQAGLEYDKEALTWVEEVCRGIWRGGASTTLGFLASHAEAYLEAITTHATSMEDDAEEVSEIGSSDASIRSLFFEGTAQFLSSLFRWGLTSPEEPNVARISDVAGKLLACPMYHSVAEMTLLNSIALKGLQAGESILHDVSSREDGVKKRRLWGEVLMLQWKRYCRCLARQMGVFSGRSLTDTHMGLLCSAANNNMQGSCCKGLELLAEILTTKELPLQDIDGTSHLGHFNTYAPSNHPALKTGEKWEPGALSPPSMRPGDYIPVSTVIFSTKLAEILQQNSQSAGKGKCNRTHHAWFKGRCLLLARAMLVVEDPQNSRVLQLQHNLEEPPPPLSFSYKEGRWERFRNGLSIQKSAPSLAILAWTQEKAATLGFVDAVIFNLFETAHAVRLEALHLGRALLQGGNRNLQELYIEGLIQHSGDFHRQFEASIGNAVTTSERWICALTSVDPLEALATSSICQKRAGEELSQHEIETGSIFEAARKVQKNVEDAFLSACQLSMLYLDTLHLLCKGPNRKGQHWFKDALVRDGEGSQSLLKVTANALIRLTQDVSKAIQLNEATHLSLFLQVVCLLRESLQGVESMNHPEVEGIKMAYIQALKILRVDLNTDPQKVSAISHLLCVRATNSCPYRSYLNTAQIYILFLQIVRLAHDVYCFVSNMR